MYVILFLGRHKYLLTPGREMTTDQSKKTTRVQLGEQMGFILLELYTRIWVEGLLAGP